MRGERVSCVRFVVLSGMYQGGYKGLRRFACCLTQMQRCTRLARVKNPPDPDGFVRQIKDKTFTPADSTHGQAPTLVTRYRYGSMPAVADSELNDWLVTESETLLQTAPGTEQLLQNSVFEYIDTPDLPFQHGRVANQIVTIDGQATTNGGCRALPPTMSTTLRTQGCSVAWSRVNN